MSILDLFRRKPPTPMECQVATDLEVEDVDGLPLVYVIGLEGGTRWYKIGKTCSLAGRLRALQTGNPLALRLECVYVCDSEHDASALERSLHRTFARYRKGGEWFAVSPIWIDAAMYEWREARA